MDSSNNIAPVTKRVNTGKGEKFSESKVSGFLREELAPVIQECVTGPALQISEKLLALRETMITCGDRFKDVTMPGYTHLQPAQPITFGYYLIELLSSCAMLTSAIGRLSLNKFVLPTSAASDRKRSV